jgi:hypothetical protein
MIGNAFAAAIDILFRDPNLARDAVHVSGGGVETAVRIITRQPDRLLELGETRLRVDTVMIDVRLAEVPELRPGDAFVIAGEAYLVQGEPARDSERLVWTAELRSQ